MFISNVPNSIVGTLYYQMYLYFVWPTLKVFTWTLTEISVIYSLYCNVSFEWVLREKHVFSCSPYQILIYTCASIGTNIILLSINKFSQKAWVILSAKSPVDLYLRHFFFYLFVISLESINTDNIFIFVFCYEYEKIIKF